MGTSAYIGVVDEITVMKYPRDPGGDMTRLEIERALLEIVGPHERITQLKGFNDTGIYLERAVNGTLSDYILKPDNPQPSIQQRLSWCRELAEAVAHVHSRGVIHCDIQPTNLLLDEGLHIKLSDFQGKQLAEDGTVLIDGWSSEPCRFSCPRDDSCESSVKTDLFAVGCTIYFIVKGHCIFPDIVDGSDGWYEAVEDRLEKGQFPQDEHACSTITSKCWLKEYESANEVLRDIESIERNFLVDSTACVTASTGYTHTLGGQGP